MAVNPLVKRKVLPQLRRGTLLGKYRLEKKLGRGGYGVVFQAYDTVEKSWVALKVIGERAAGIPTACELAALDLRVEQ